MAKSGTAKYEYETDKGNIFYARGDDAASLDPIRGAAPTGSITENITFEFSKNAKEVGCRPRHVTLQRQVVDPNAPTCLIDAYGVTKDVIVLTPAHFNSLTTGQSGTTVTYSGVTWRVKAKVSEQMR